MKRDGLHLNTKRARRASQQGKSAHKIFARRNDLVGLTFTCLKQYKKAIAQFKKNGLEHSYDTDDTEKHSVFRRLIVPKKIVRHMRGFTSQYRMVSRENLPNFVKKNIHRRQARWHAGTHSHILEIILQYKYFLKDYVISHIGLFAEALAQKKDSARIH